MEVVFEDILKTDGVRSGLASTAGALSAKWRDENKDWIRMICITTLWELLQNCPKFRDELDLLYYIFGNFRSRNRLYWMADQRIKKERGIRCGSVPHVDLDEVSNILSAKEEERAPIIKKLSEVYQSDLLTPEEKCVVALSFNLSVMEDHREDHDRTPWSIREISKMMGVRETSLLKVKKRALEKLKPMLEGIRNG